MEKREAGQAVGIMLRILATSAGSLEYNFAVTALRKKYPKQLSIFQIGGEVESEKHRYVLSERGCQTNI